VRSGVARRAGETDVVTMSDRDLSLWVVEQAQFLMLSYLLFGLLVMLLEWAEGAWRGLGLVRWQDLDMLDPLLRAKLLIYLLLSWSHRAPMTFWVYGVLMLSHLGFEVARLQTL